MNVTRRGFLMVGLGLLAAGCTHHQVSERPNLEWPEPLDRPRVYPGTGGYPVGPRPAPLPPPVAAPLPPTNPSATVTIGPIQAIPRSQWARAEPIMSKINPMAGIDRITVHHEGWREVWTSDFRSTAALIEHDRIAHLGMFNAGDIGYHFIIDRAGRVWQGRDVRYQGAHVRANNEHNLGVMVLGNFDLQSPSEAQLTTLRDTLIKLRRQYKVPVNRIYTHQELKSTECPGTALQPKMVWLRRSGSLA